MSDSKKLRIAIIGAVHDHFWPVWGKGVFHEFRDHPGATLVAATEHHPELQTRLRTELGIERIYTDYEEMLEKECLDAVLIGLPSNAKVGPVRAAARKGLHILMDKPLCTTMEDARELQQIVRETGVNLVVNSLSIWKAPLRKGFDLVNEGAIGRPFWAKWRNANAGTEKAPGVSRHFTDWLWDMEKNGGGILINYCYYGISYLCHIFGRPRSVSAMAGHFVKEQIPTEMEDNAIVTMKWDGALGQAEGSWTQWDEGLEEEVDPTNRGLIVYGTKGVLRTSSKGYVVLVNAEFPKGKRIDCSAVPVRFKDGAEHFVSVVRGESHVDPLCSLDLNVLVQEISTAGYQSIREKREITLPSSDLQ
ncbi:Gfo/Idh/MocA family protein [Paraburkholderia oxyphila]|uniref:Gfo/Idh/MocA family protein n=1 Tax=Paraburkholderia oxyphila TaxID=614212 RepID=UPI000488062A|nr:Gfo/Idh/MocA family oxidoreductase [Paraburkholderia oxyphila]